MGSFWAARQADLVRSSKASISRGLGQQPHDGFDLPCDLSDEYSGVRRALSIWFDRGTGILA
jgi:hypothetical protein